GSSAELGSLTMVPGRAIASRIRRKPRWLSSTGSAKPLRTGCMLIVSTIAALQREEVDLRRGRPSGSSLAHLPLARRERCNQLVLDKPPPAGMLQQPIHDRRELRPTGVAA